MTMSECFAPCMLMVREVGRPVTAIRSPRGPSAASFLLRRQDSGRDDKVGRSPVTFPWEPFREGLGMLRTNENGVRSCPNEALAA